MKCEEAKDQLVAYTRGELEGSSRQALEDHLGHCSECASELEDCKKVLSITEMAMDSSVLDLSAEPIRAAIREGASDIHLDVSMRDGIKIRFRADGVLRSHTPSRELPLELTGPVLARLKIMAECDARETKLPQEGRIPVVDKAGNHYEVRTSFVPTITGESVVMRILNRSRVLIGLDKLGFLPDTLQALQQLMRRGAGLFAATGPAGAGKSTVLYSLLNSLNLPEMKLVTVEDPVEYSLPGVAQIHDSNFARALRVLLRQDPDVLMVAEIRDMESLGLTMGAASTGHLVLTALHAGNTISALRRLQDAALPSMVADGTLGVLAQRLARKICTSCREEYSAPRDLLLRLGFSNTASAPERLHRGRGCDACHETGFKGRVGVHELLVVKDAVRDAIARQANETELRQAALDAGLRTLQQDALEKVLLGWTTVDEALRVVEYANVA